MGIVSTPFRSPPLDNEWRKEVSLDTADAKMDHGGVGFALQDIVRDDAKFPDTIKRQRFISTAQARGSHRYVKHTVDNALSDGIIHIDTHDIPPDFFGSGETQGVRLKACWEPELPRTNTTNAESVQYPILSAEVADALLSLPSAADLIDRTERPLYAAGVGGE
jgi:hypothetical protein